MPILIWPWASIASNGHAYAQLAKHIGMNEPLSNIKTLASARVVLKREKKAKSPEIRRSLPVPIYIFHDSEQTVECKARIKTWSHQQKI